MKYAARRSETRPGATTHSGTGQTGLNTGGEKKLKEHLSILTAFAKAAGYNWTGWDRMVKRALPKFEKDGSAAQELPFTED